MSKLYFIENGRCKCKDGSSTSGVGDSGAVHVSQGLYSSKEAFAITYDDGDVKITVGNSTSDVRHGLSNEKITQTQFNDNGIIVTSEKGNRYFSHSGGGNRL